LDLFDDGDEWLNERLIDTSEVQVRKVDKRPHGGPAI